MNKLKGSLLAAALCFTGAACLFIASCGDKNSIEYVFETNGGEAIENVTLEPGEQYTLPIPEREGYSFEGWYLTSDFSGEPVETVSAETSQTYYAKWEQMYLITLDLNGGTLSTSVPSLYLKAGENIYDAVREYVPSMDGCEFGGWFVGENELSESATMTSAGITLTARYRVGYTIEIYRQNLAQTGYEKDTDTVTGYEYAGISYSPEYALTGFTLADTADSVNTLVLSSDASENVFKFYYDRNEYTVIFHSNYPDGSGQEADSKNYTVVYGNEIELLPDMYVEEGYLLVGWSTRPTGRLMYSTDFSSVLRNDTENLPVDAFIPSGNLELYAVWSEGYTDLFGGSDYIYLPEENAEVVYLSRNGFLFWGEYDFLNKEFFFEDSDNNILLEGRLYDDGTYIYSDAERDGLTSTLYEIGNGLIDTTSIYLDAYNGITYSVTDEETGRTSSSDGTYVIDEDGLYVATFTSGTLSGQTLHLLVGYVTLNNVRYSAFQVRNEDEYNLGTMVRFAVMDSAISYYTTAYMLRLNGLGIATYNAGTSSEANYYYTSSEDGLITLMYSNGNVFGVVGIIDDFTRSGYMVYYEDMDNTFTSDSGATLELDGLYTGTYTNGNQIVRGYYSFVSSALGGYIVTLADPNTPDEKYVFRIAVVEESAGEVGGETETAVQYILEEKPVGYTEYRYIASGGIQTGAPLLVLDDTAEGRATLYGYTGQAYEKVSEGAYTYNAETQTYLFTVDGEVLHPDILTEPFDLVTIRSIVFGIGTSGSYNVSYWYSVTTEEGTDEYDEQYNEENGDATLTLVGGFAIYRENAAADLVAGTYSLSSSGVLTLSGNNEYLYFELNEAEGTFVVLLSSPDTAIALGADGQANQNETLAIDGKGGATYTVSSDEEGVEDIVYTGNVSETGNVTLSNAIIYRFSSDGLAFDFIYLSSSLTRYFARYNETYNGVYTASDGSVLTLDGFSYEATYVDADRYVYEGRYSISSENVVSMIIDDTTYYFDLVGESFTLRGEEYGTYLLMDNQYITDIYLTFDGYGGLSVYTYEDTGEENSTRVDIDPDGTYEILARGYRLVYTDGNATHTIEGVFDTVTSGNYLIHVFAVEHEAVVTSYLNEEDWSVLYLDGCGGAVKYNRLGVAESGSYVIITENLLYYVNDAGSDACIYEYDTERGVATPKTFTARGYYTADLESLVFSEYGFMIFNGETRYYYNIETDGTVIIYRQDPGNALANDYGFVWEDFGEFTNVKEFDGKTYYRNSGYAIQFNRDEDTASYYPVPANDGESYQMEALTFMPGGGEEFSVSGTVYIGGILYNCTVTRTVSDDGTAEMYVSVGYFRFYITVSYTGERDDGTSDNTYEITAMRLYYESPSYAYLTNYYIYAVLYGRIIENTFGTVSVITDYNTAGEQERSYVLAQFGESMGLYDSLGNPIPVPEGEIEYTREALNENVNLYVLEFEGDDGYLYRMYFVLTNHSLINSISYYVYAVTRVETLETTDGYTVEVERYIYTDNTRYYSEGDYWSIEVTKNGEALESDVILLLSGELYYVVRETDNDGNITQTIYYQIEFVENESTETEEGDSPLPTYQSVTIVPEEVTTLYDNTGEAYIDMRADGEIVLVYFGGSVHLTVTSSGDESTGYTLEMNSGRTFRITFLNGVPSIIDVTDSN